MTALILANTVERNIIIGMALVGLIFIAVIALGETSRWLRHRNPDR